MEYPTPADWEAGRVKLVARQKREFVEESLRSGFYQEPQQLASWFQAAELERLKDISWDTDHKDQLQFEAVFLRPFTFDGHMVSAPIQLILRLGRSEFVRLYKSRNHIDRQRIIVAFADDELPASATESDLADMIRRTRFGPQQGFLQTLHMVSDIESHLATLALGVVNFHVQESVQQMSRARRILEKVFPIAWRLRVIRDIHRSNLLFVVPSFHQGTLWEIEQIVSQGLQKKLYFLIPTILSEDLSLVAHYWRQTFHQLETRLGLKTGRSLPFDRKDTLSDKQFLLRLEGTVLCLEKGILNTVQPLHFFRFLRRNNGARTSNPAE